MIIFRNRSFGLLWTGQLLSSGGNWLLRVAVPVYVFHLTRSASDTGLTVVAEILPLLMLGPVAGVFADRWPRRRIVIGTNLLCAGAVSLVLLASRPSQLWLVLLAVFAENCFCAFFGPACQGVVPALVGRGRDLELANAWSAAAAGAVRLTCAPLGGALYALAGLRLPVAIDAGTYLAAALLVSLIRSPRPGRPDHGARETAAAETAAAQSAAPRSAAPLSAGLRQVAVDLRAGVAALIGDRVLKVLLGVSALFLLGNGACSALLVPYVVASLGVRAASIGELYSALGVGYLLSTYLGRRACASPRLRRTVLCQLGLLVLAFAGLFNLHDFALALVFIGLMGLGGGAFLMLEQTTLQRRAPDHVIGRISSAYSTVVMAATLAGALLASVVVTWLGRAVALNLAIAVMASAAAVATRLPARVAQRGDNDGPRNVHDDHQTSTASSPSASGSRLGNAKWMCSRGPGNCATSLARRRS
jgi:predicted MFS family arabinose efflux permease